MVPPTSNAAEGKPPEKRLLRIREVAKYLNLGENTIRDMIRRKELKAVIRRPGRPVAWLVRIEECDRWIEKNSTTPTRPGARY